MCIPREAAPYAPARRVHPADIRRGSLAAQGASELHKTRKRPDATPPGDTVPVGVRCVAAVTTLVSRPAHPCAEGELALARTARVETPTCRWSLTCPAPDPYRHEALDSPTQYATGDGSCAVCATATPTTLTRGRARHWGWRGRRWRGTRCRIRRWTACWQTCWRSGALRQSRTTKPCCATPTPPASDSPEARFERCASLARRLQAGWAGPSHAVGAVESVNREEPGERRDGG